MFRLVSSCFTLSRHESLQSFCPAVVVGYVTYLIQDQSLPTPLNVGPTTSTRRRHAGPSARAESPRCLEASDPLLRRRRSGGRAVLGVVDLQRAFAQRPRPRPRPRSRHGLQAVRRVKLQSSRASRLRRRLSLPIASECIRRSRRERHQVRHPQFLPLLVLLSDGFVPSAASSRCLGEVEGPAAFRQPPSPPG